MKTCSDLDLKRAACLTLGHATVYVFGLVVATLVGGCRQPVDLVVYNANVYTVDGDLPHADAFAVQDGLFAAVGDSAEIFSLYDPAAAVDAKGSTVIPGLIDAHGHLLNEGLLRLSVDLVGSTSISDVVDRLRERDATLPAGEWLYGRGWDQNDWQEARFPVRQDLDSAFPSRPVWIERIDGHAILVNTAALKIIGMDAVRIAPDPVGGRIARDRRGLPTGLFIDAAEDIVTAAAPPPSSATLREAIRLANAEAVRFGLTGVHEAGLKLDTLRLYREAADAGILDVRVYAMIEDVGPAMARQCVDGPVTDYLGRLWINAVKIYSDGALGSRGAALIEPYSDDPDNRGLLRKTAAELAADIRRVVQCGLQPAVHAIGDRAVRVVLDAYEEIGASGRMLRPRIEHAQIINPGDLDRFAKLDVIAVMQPTHATSDMYWAEERVGSDRLELAYAWRSLLDSGAHVAFGSDFPVELVNPIAGFYAAVTRQDATGWPDGGWRPDQRVSRVEALRGFTIDAAYAAFMEEEVGSIRSGKRADFVLLDRDIMTIPVETIMNSKVLATYVDGVTVYDVRARD